MWTEICFYFASIFFFSVQIGTFLHPKSPGIKIFIFHHHFRKGMQMSHHHVYCSAFINHPSLKWNSSQHNRKLKNLHFWTRFSKSINFSMNFLLLELNTHSLLFLFLFAFSILFFLAGKLPIFNNGTNFNQKLYTKKFFWLKFCPSFLFSSSFVFIILLNNLISNFVCSN